MTDAAIRLVVELDQVQPTIWRELVVRAEIDLHQLHLLLQGAMGWQNRRAHEFIIDGRHYRNLAGDGNAPLDAAVPRPLMVVANPSAEHRIEDERSIKLHHLLLAFSPFFYVYDFAARWRHRVIFKQVCEDDVGPCAGTCVGGSHACPPENLGGVEAFHELLEIMRTPLHPRHQEVMRAIGGRTNPKDFSPAKANAHIATIVDAVRSENSHHGALSYSDRRSCGRSRR